MVTVSYPGVYIQEVPSGVRTIEGVSTSIGAFFGRASKGPNNQAIRLLGYADYERQFGAPFPGRDLAYSVRMFFDNGGTDCYVICVENRPADALEREITDLLAAQLARQAREIPPFLGDRQKREL